jgi:hypothetical protein
LALAVDEHFGVGEGTQYEGQSSVWRWERTHWRLEVDRLFPFSQTEVFDQPPGYDTPFFAWYDARESDVMLARLWRTGSLRILRLEDARGTSRHAFIDVTLPWPSRPLPRADVVNAFAGCLEDEGEVFLHLCTRTSPSFTFAVDVRSAKARLVAEGPYLFSLDRDLDTNRLVGFALGSGRHRPIHAFNGSGWTAAGDVPSGQGLTYDTERRRWVALAWEPPTRSDEASMSMPALNVVEREGEQWHAPRPPTRLLVPRLNVALAIVPAPALQFVLLGGQDPERSLAPSLEAMASPPGGVFRRVTDPANPTSFGRYNTALSMPDALLLTQHTCVEVAVREGGQWSRWGGFEGVRSQREPRSISDDRYLNFAAGDGQVLMQDADGNVWSAARGEVFLPLSPARPKRLGASYGSGRTAMAWDERAMRLLLVTSPKAYDKPSRLLSFRPKVGWDVISTKKGPVLFAESALTSTPSGVYVGALSAPFPPLPQTVTQLWRLEGDTWHPLRELPLAVAAMLFDRRRDRLLLVDRESVRTWRDGVSGAAVTLPIRLRWHSTTEPVIGIDPIQDELVLTDGCETYAVALAQLV